MDSLIVDNQSDPYHWFFKGNIIDGHYTIRGHEVVADMLLPYIKVLIPLNNN